jgi:hypothetical protein
MIKTFEGAIDFPLERRSQGWKSRTPDKQRGARRASQGGIRRRRFRGPDRGQGCGLTTSEFRFQIFASDVDLLSDLGGGFKDGNAAWDRVHKYLGPTLVLNRF